MVGRNRRSDILRCCYLDMCNTYSGLLCTYCSHLYKRSQGTHHRLYMDMCCKNYLLRWRLSLLRTCVSGTTDAIFRTNANTFVESDAVVEVFVLERTVRINSVDWTIRIWTDVCFVVVGWSVFAFTKWILTVADAGTFDRLKIFFGQASA